MNKLSDVIQISPSGNIEYRNNLGEEVRNQGKYKSPYELVYQPDGTFAMIKRGTQPRQGEIVTAMSEDGFAF